MLNWIHNGRGVFKILRFLAPDGGGNSGGGSGDSSNAGTVDVDLLFKDIPFDELDSKTQQALKATQDKLKTSFANLQKQSVDSPENKNRIANLEKQARDFQSSTDQLKDQLKVLLGGSPSGTPTEDEYLKSAQDVLRKSGFSEDEVKKNAPVYVNLLKSQLSIFKTELGRDIRPMAASVIMGEAQTAFESALDSDASGRLAIPEVAQTVWEKVQERAKQGGQVTSDLVINLGKIAYADHADKLRGEGKDVPIPAPRSSSTASMNTGGFTFPGAGRVGSGMSPVVRHSDQNTAKTTMNADTEAAVEVTFKNLYRDTGVAPKHLKSKFEPAK